MDDETQLNMQYAYRLLFIDNSTGREMSPVCPPTLDGNSLTLVVETLDGTTKLRHTITTEGI